MSSDNINENNNNEYYDNAYNANAYNDDTNYSEHSDSDNIDDAIDINDTDNIVDTTYDLIDIIDYENIEYEKEYIIHSNANQSGTRIDKFISDRIPDLSRSYIQKLIKDQYVLINKAPVKSNYKINNLENVSIIFPKPKAIDIKPENIPLNIVYEDSDLLIINKPKGMVVHPAPGHYSGTMVNALMYHCKDELSGINGICRPGIVHRIDKDTTGLLIVCKNDRSHNNIALQLKDHSITRTYNALVHNNIIDNAGTVNKPIARGTVDRKKMAVNPAGKEAVTHYSVLERYSYKNKSYTYIKCNLETGRTHQIRVHMSSINHPLVGDTIYGYNSNRQPFVTEGQMLHAKTIGFIHPSTNKYIEFDSKLPDYFERILNILSATIQ